MTAGGSLNGFLSDVQVLSRMLTEEEAFGYMDCSKLLVGDIAAWGKDEDWEIAGSLVRSDRELSKICPAGDSGDKKIMIMPARLDYQGIYFLLCIFFIPFFLLT